MGGFLAAVTQREFWSGAQIRQFVSEPEISKFVLERNTGAKQAFYGEKPSLISSLPSTDLRAVLIFTADKQQDWLIAGADFVYYVIDQRQWFQPKVKWGEKRENLRPVRTDEPLHSDGMRPDRIGVLHLGDPERRRLFYSKDLFLNDRPEDAIERFLALTNT